jgi:hypothetical protein
MLAFLPLLVPVFVRLVPLLVGAGAGALAVSAVNSSDRKEETIKDLKARIDRLEQRDSK